ncbi:MAG: alpha/beta hydrolase [Rhodospirillales bacterium]|nr:alpha/beta hydrolase [Rhodospirillales bacterium]
MAGASELINFVAVAAGVYAAVVGGMYFAQRHLMYLPDTSVPSAAASGVPEMVEVGLTTEDGLRLRSWYREAVSGAPTIVYFCGNGGHIGYRGFKVRPFLDAGLGVLMVSYRGYGGNEGSPTEEGLYADGRAALAFLHARGVPRKLWILYGESLGSGVAVQLAQEIRDAALDETSVGALVLESPFTSMVDAAGDHYPWAPTHLLVRDRYDSAEKIGRLKSPLLILHGEQDTIVSVRHGRRLFELAPEPKEARWYKNAGHNDLFEHGTAPVVLDFLRRHGPSWNRS